METNMIFKMKIITMVAFLITIANSDAGGAGTGPRDTLSGKQSESKAAPLGGAGGGPHNPPKGRK
jgi:hypothetical protein